MMAGLRRLAVPIGIVAAVLLVLLFNPWVIIEEGVLRQALTIGFWPPAAGGQGPTANASTAQSAGPFACGDSSPETRGCVK